MGGDWCVDVSKFRRCRNSLLKLHIHLSEVIDDLKNAKCKPPSAQARNAYDTGAFQLNQSWYLTPTKMTISTLPALHLTNWMLGWHLGLARHRVLQDTASSEVFHSYLPRAWSNLKDRDQSWELSSSSKCRTWSPRVDSSPRWPRENAATAVGQQPKGWDQQTWLSSQQTWR